MNQLQDAHSLSQGELEAFSLGDLDGEAAAVVEQHIERCDKCSETLLVLSSGDDTFVASLKRAVSPATPTDETLELPASGVETRWQDTDEEIPPELTEHPRYRILELVGKGGMGVVYMAEHTLMQRRVALKLINKRLVANPKAVERFHREVQAAARLSHPNIVTAYDADKAGDRHFLVMEYIDGTDLAEIVEREGPLNVRQACRYAKQAADGLHNAHENGMVHRDVKPNNLMITREDEVKILDFGLASVVAEASQLPEHEEAEEAPDARLTSYGSTLGTPDYISPEQVQDARKADIRSDIYSLGCTLYYSLTGQSPFPGDSVADKLQSHVSLAPPALSERDFPQELSDVVAKMMAKDPAARFQSPAEVAAALEPFCQSPRVARKLTRRVAVLAVAAAALLPAAGWLALRLNKGSVEFDIAADLQLADSTRIVLTRAGREEAAVFAPAESKRKTLRLPAGDYQITLRGGAADQQLVVWSKTGDSRNWGSPDPHAQAPVTLRRGGGILIRLEASKPPRTPDPTGPAIAVLEKTWDGRRFRPLDVAYSPNGVWIASADSNGHVVLDATTTASQKTLAEHGPREVWSLAFSKDGNWLAAAVNQLGFQLYKVPLPPNVEMIAIANIAPEFEIPSQVMEARSVAFAPDNTLLAVGVNKAIYFWQARVGGKPESSVTAHDGMVTALVFSPDGSTLASASRDGQIALFDFQNNTATLRSRFDAHANGVTCLVFSPDGKTLASGGFDGKVKLWDGTSGLLIRELNGHLKDVTSVAFHPTQPLVASSSADMTIRLWDPRSGDARQVLRDHGDRVQSAAFSPNGTHLVSISLDGAMVSWKLMLEEKEEE